MKYLEEYDISIDESGNIYYNNKIVKPFIQSRGYLQVSLYPYGIRTKLLVHRLVAIAYLNCDSKNVVSHKDGNKLNNHKDNLIVHSRKNAMKESYSKNPWDTANNYILNEEDVNKIREVGYTKNTLETANEYGVSRSTIQKILSRSIW